MARIFSVTEPHPSVPKTGGYIGGGRGGAGNYQRYNSTELTAGPNASGPASRVSLTKQVRRTIPAGRGGAGNFFHDSEEAIFQFDEEMLKKREAQAAPVYHIGRGGAANFVDATKESSVRKSFSRKDSTSSQASNESTHSNDSTTQRVLSQIFGRRSS